MNENLEPTENITNIEKINKPEQNSADTIINLSSIDIDNIKKHCFYIKNANARGRAFINLLSEKAGSVILQNLGINTSNSTALQKIESVLNKIDISELFIGNKRVDIRCNFGDYKLFISKKQEKYNMTADVYMFIKLDEAFTKMSLLGFISKNDIDFDNSDDKNYYIDESQLKTFEEIKESLLDNTSTSENNKFKQKSIEQWHSDIIKYSDGNLQDKIAFLQTVAESKELRKMLISFEHSERVFRELAKQENIIKKEVEKDITSISKLADAFIQSKGIILGDSKENSEIYSAVDFKIECARKNLEKLFNNNEIEDSAEKINERPNDEVVDSLLTKGKTIETFGYKRLKTLLNILIAVIITAFIIVFAATYLYTSDFPETINSHIQIILHHNK